MKKNIAIYDSSSAIDLNVDRLLRKFMAKGVTELFYKLLSPNDNSKNQPYFAGHLEELSFLPTGNIDATPSSSHKTTDTKRKIKYLVGLDFKWMSPDGDIFPAPDAKLIYYPQYPEVRLSGYVTKTGFDMAGWMDPEKKGRSEGRVLFLGVKPNGEMLAYLAIPHSRIAREILAYPSLPCTGVFREINLHGVARAVDGKQLLLTELKRIHDKGWISSKRLDRDGNIKNYMARNGGGYTLEAELGITPNGYSEPDFHGWEVKQFGVKKCEACLTEVLTIMTPEPDAGYYVDQGVNAFMHTYGRRRDPKVDRLDFTGSHYANRLCSTSGLQLVLQGFNSDTRKISEADGYIGLLDKKGNIASSWSFGKLLEHWKRKHAKAVYVPSLSRQHREHGTAYSYCNNLRLFEGTTVARLLGSISDGLVYYDPGIKLVNIDTHPVSKRRSQFRIKSRDLHQLYENQSDIDLSQIRT